MSKRIRRLSRCILCDSEEIARGIERYCLDNGFVEGMRGKAYTTCYASYLGTTRFGSSKWAVTFDCTLDQWNRIANHYDLVRLKTFKYHFVYKMRT